MRASLVLPPTMRMIERDWLSSNNVLFTGDGTTALVDSGYAKHAEMTVALVRHLLGGRGLDLLLNTHLHSDHCGGNALLQASWQCRTLIPAASAEVARRWDTDRMKFASTGQRCDRFGFDGVLEDGEAIELGELRWRAIAAPGHDPDAIVLHCADEGILISGDALWQDGFGVIFPEVEGQSGFSEQRGILERIAALDIGIVIPGHGPMFTDVADAIDRAHRRLDYLSADPARNARHAIKVLLKFLLLDRDAIRLEDVRPLLASMAFIQLANRRQLGMTEEALADWAVDSLVKSRAAHVADGVLLNG